ncbi:MAG: universal stress protein [Clostridiales bacterium]|nr:universal stress protein [Clostridiales bacterium]
MDILQKEERSLSTKSSNAKPANSNTKLKNLHILVCITQQKTCERLIKKAVELRKDSSDSLFVLHVVKNDLNFLDNVKEGEALEYLFGISKSVGANLTVLKSDHIAETIAEFAETNRINCIIMGESPKDQNDSSFLIDLKKHLKEMEIITIP